MVYMLIRNLVVLFIFAYWSLSIRKVQYKSQFMIDKKGRTVFYPKTFNKGFVATDEQINNAGNALKKLYYFNIKGFFNEIDNIFQNCEVVETKLSRECFIKNQAKNFSWLQLLTLLFISVSIIITCWQFKVLVSLMSIVAIINTQLVVVKLKNKG